MTALDLENPQHVEALRWTAQTLAGHGMEHARRLLDDNCWTCERRRVALETLTAPARAAELVRGLLEKAVVVDPSTDYDDFGDYWRIDVTWAGMDVLLCVKGGDVPRLVLALLDATSAAEAMAAVQEVGN